MAGKNNQSIMALVLVARVLITESSILAQNERWRRVSSMQVERIGLRAWKRRTGE